jgi:hypothetical protein
MKRVENYKGYVIDTDTLGRQYIYCKSSPYSENSDNITLGTGLKVKEIKSIIDLRISTGQDVRSL